MAFITPLERFKTSLEARVQALINVEPRLESDSDAPIDTLVPELATFRRLKGLPQLVFYYFNKRAIRAAVQYEALLSLSTEAAALSGSSDFVLNDSDRALYDVFAKNTPAGIDLLQLLSTLQAKNTERMRTLEDMLKTINLNKVIAVLTQNKYASRCQTLEKSLTNIDPHLNRPELIREFFMNLLADINAYREETMHTYEAQLGLLLKQHIEEVFDINPAPAKSIAIIQFKHLPVSDIETPEHLLRLPEQGTAKDMENLFVDQDDNQPDPSEPSKHEAIFEEMNTAICNVPKVYEVKLFNWSLFNWHIMSDLGETLKSDFKSLKDAHQQQKRDLERNLREFKTAFSGFLGKWYSDLLTHFQGIIQSAYENQENTNNNGLDAAYSLVNNAALKVAHQMNSAIATASTYLTQFVTERKPANDTDPKQNTISWLLEIFDSTPPPPPLDDDLFKLKEPPKRKPNTSDRISP